MSPIAKPQSIDRIVHEPARYQILALLSVVKEADFLFVMRQTGLTRGNLSSHMSKLEKAGYVSVVKDFMGKKPHTMMRITRTGRIAFEGYRNAMKQMLERSIP
jgi:DNA-binding transcriptional ArsR family regulator